MLLVARCSLLRGAHCCEVLHVDAHCCEVLHSCFINFLFLGVVAFPTSLQIIVTGAVSRRKNQGATLHNDLQGNWCTSFGVFKVTGVPGFGFPTFHPSQPLKIPRGEIEAGDSVEILPLFCGRYSKFTPACRIGVCCEELKVHPRTITCSGSNPIWAWVCRILKGEIEPGVLGMTG